MALVIRLHPNLYSPVCLKHPMHRKMGFFSDENGHFYFAPCSSEHWSSLKSILPLCWGDHMAPKLICCCFMEKKMKWWLGAAVLFQRKSSLLNHIDGTEHSQSTFSIKTFSQNPSLAPLDHDAWNPKFFREGSLHFVHAFEHWRTAFSYLGVLRNVVQTVVPQLASI